MGWDSPDLGFREVVEVGLDRTVMIGRLEGEAVGDEERELGFQRKRRSREEGLVAKNPWLERERGEREIWSRLN